MTKKELELQLKQKINEKMDDFIAALPKKASQALTAKELIEKVGDDFFTARELAGQLLYSNKVEVEPREITKTKRYCELDDFGIPMLDKVKVVKESYTINAYYR